MSYAVKDLRLGDVILCTSAGSLLDRLLAWSNGPFVHAALVGNGHLIEQVWTARDAALDEYAGIGWVFGVKATMKQRYDAVAWAESKLGARYGIEELLLDGARFDAHWWPRRAMQPRRWTCSGFVAQAYRAAGVALTWAPYPSPVDLACSPLLIGPRPWLARGA